MTTSRRHILPNAASDLQLVFGNLGPDKLGDETPGPNPIIITAEVEYPHGIAHNVLFRGERTVEIEGGTLVTSDPLNVLIPDGAECHVRTNVAVTSPPYKWPLNAQILAEFGDWIEFGTAENRMFAPPPMPRWHAFYGYGPFNILGRMQEPHVSVVILGDSVVASDLGFVTRALNGKIPWFNCSMAGNSLARFLRASNTRVALIDGHFTHVICSLGIADIRHSDEANIRKHFGQVWELLSGRGLKVFQTTITPDTTSSDRWQTEAGQTPRQSEFLPGGVYQRINEWIRQVPSPLVGCFDVSAVIDSSVDSGLWTSSHGGPVTFDGVHPNDWGAQVAATCVNVGMLRQ